MKQRLRFGLVRLVFVALVVTVACSHGGDEGVVTPRQDGLLPSDALTGALVPTEGHPGWMEGSFSVTHDGAATYRIPLYTMEGRRGIEPALALAYNSRGGNGLLGVGWVIEGLSEITLCAKRVAYDGVTDLDPADPAYCLDGKRIRGQHAEGDPYTLLARAGTQTFRAYMRDGRILTYGAVDGRTDAFVAGQVYGTGTTFPYAFLLSKVEDRYGNYMTITYERADSDGAVEYRPSEIQYTGHPHIGVGQRFVKFLYTHRPDPITVFVRGAGIRQTQRLHAVRMEYADEPGGPTRQVRRYDMTYGEESGATGRSLLRSVREHDGTRAWRDSLQFEYQSGSPAPEGSNEVDTGLDLPYYLPPLDDETPELIRTLAMDVDADGRDDLLVGYRGLYWGARGWQVYSPRGGVWQRKESNIPDNWVISPHAAHSIDVGHFYAHYLDEYGRTKSGSYYLDVTSPSGVPGDWELSVEENWTGSSTCSYGSPAALLVGDFRGHGTSTLLRGCGASSTRLRYGSGEYIDIGLEIGTATFNVLDLDGDGRQELLATGPDAPCAWDPDPMDPTTQCYRLAGFAPDGTPEPVQSLDLDADRPLVFLDINGDGLKDIVALQHPTSRFGVRMNTGAGFTPEMDGLVVGADLSFEWDDSLGQLAEYWTREAFDVKVGDFNRDGRDDFVMLFDRPGWNEQVCGVSFHCPPRPEVAVLHLSLGQQFKTHVFGHPGPVDFVNVEDGTEPTRRIAWGRTGVADTDGDGLLELFVGAGEPEYWLDTGIPRLSIRKYYSEHPDLLSRVRRGSTTDASFEYEVTRGYYPSALAGSLPPGNPAYRPSGSCAAPIRCTNDSMLVVSHHTDELGHGYTHFYQDGRRDSEGRGWLGFSHHFVINDDTLAVTETGFRNEPGYAHQPAYALRIVPDGSRFYVERVDYVREMRETSSSTPYPVLTERRTRRADVHYWSGWEHGCTLGGTVTPQSCFPAASDLEELEWQNQIVETFDYDGYATLTFHGVETWDAGRQELMVTPEDRPGTLLFGLPHIVTRKTFAPGSTTPKTATVVNEHDPQGGIAKQFIEPTTGSYRRQTQFVPTMWGLPEKVEVDHGGSNLRTTTFGYEGERLHASSITNTLGHEVLRGYEPTTGQLVYERDVLGVETRRQVDGFGRVRAVIDPDGGSTVSYVSISPDQMEVRTTPLGGPEQWTRIDRFGRVREQRTGVRLSWSLQRFSYDDWGRLATKEQPHFEGEYATVREKYHYDPLDRLTRLEVDAPDPVPDLLVAYFGNWKTVIRGDGVSRDYEYDDLGRLKNQVEYDDELGWVSTQYQYDGAGLLEKVSTVAAGGILATEQWSYDAWGRLTSHAGSDGVSRTYTYTAFDELDQEFLGASLLREHKYDQLGRLEYVMTPEDGTTTFEWDTAPNGLGQLGRAYTNGGRTDTSYVYDARGRLAWRETIIEGQKFFMQYKYDAVGRLDRFKYGVADEDWRQMDITYQYADGYLEEVSGGLVGEDPLQVFWRADELDAYGRVIRELRGLDGNIETTRGFDAETGRLEEVETSSSWTGSLQHQSFEYDVAGRMADRWDHLVGTHETFDYDDFDRLRLWTFDGRPTEFEYDPLGNLRKRWSHESETELIYDDPLAPHLPTGIAGVGGVGHDGRGRLVVRPGLEVLGYTGFDLPTEVRTTTASMTFAYDAFQNRVLRESASTRSVFIDEVYEQHTDASGTVDVFRVMAGGQPIAQVVRSDLDLRVEYLYPDGLGSIQAIADFEGNSVQDLRYDPFGTRIDPATGAPLSSPPTSNGPGFTGHVHDDALGLIHMRGRTYDPLMGRFLTKDPIRDVGAGSQGMNPFSYVRNNPTNLTDPSGLYPCDMGTSCYSPWESALATLAVIAGAAANGFRDSSGTVGTAPPIPPMRRPPPRFPDPARRPAPTVVDSHGESGGSADAVGHAPAMAGGLPDRFNWATREGFRWFHNNVNLAMGGLDMATSAAGLQHLGALSLIDPDWSLSRYARDAVGLGAFVNTDSDAYAVGKYVALAGSVLVPGGGAVSAARRVGGSTSVYRSLNAAGEVRYVGITNNLGRRAAEHVRTRGIHIEEVVGELSRAEARGVEQALINGYRLAKHGGTLQNRINSISRLNPFYRSLVRRGERILDDLGYMW